MRPSSLTGETLQGDTVSFSHEAYTEAMDLYGLRETERVVQKLEAGKHVRPEVADFFRDFAIIQAVDHPDFDRGVGIGSLATRIELATGQVTAKQLEELGVDLEADRLEYDLAFGTSWPPGETSSSPLNRVIRKLLPLRRGALR